MKKILIVDDEEDACKVLEKIMADAGYEAFSANSGQSALNIIRKKRPDLILLDIKMPQMDGIETLKRIKKIDKDVVVVMITAYSSLDTVQAAMELDAYDYISKPFDMASIKAVVKEALSKSKSQT